MYSDSEIVNYDTTENSNKNNHKTVIHRKDVDKPLLVTGSWARQWINDLTHVQNSLLWRPQKKWIYRGACIFLQALQGVLHFVIKAHSIGPHMTKMV
jgi:hypothetical protein